jgi:hypothetical protein
MQKLLVSVSGGRTSALMAKLLWDRFRGKYDMVFVFANTSREREETLIFLNQLEKEFKLPIVWVEAVVHHDERKSSTHKIVTFETACRDGSVFENVIKKYGIPNVKFIHCTRELKANPINSYAKSIGFEKCITGIGYRYDEPKRVNLIKAKENNQWYPLYEWRIKKTDVASFWLKQSFDLQLKDYEGNCKLCYKKSKRKLMTSLSERPEDAQWIKDMEDKYSEGINYFFRENETVDQIIQESKLPFIKAIDQSLIIDRQLYFDFYLDEQESCAESCEPFAI